MFAQVTTVSESLTTDGTDMWLQSAMHDSVCFELCRGRKDLAAVRHRACVRSFARVSTRVLGHCIAGLHYSRAAREGTGVGRVVGVSLEVTLQLWTGSEARRGGEGCTFGVGQSVRDGDRGRVAMGIAWTARPATMVAWARSVVECALEGVYVSAFNVGMELGRICKGLTTRLSDVAIIGCAPETDVAVRGGSRRSCDRQAVSILGS